MFDHILNAAFKDEYKETFPVLGTKEEFIALFDGHKPTDRTEAHSKLYRDILKTKSKYWDYEKEWRISVPMPEHIGKDYAYVYLDSLVVTEAYLGCETSESEKAAIRHCLKSKYPKCKIFQSQMSKSSFALEFHELHES